MTLVAEKPKRHRPARPGTLPPAKRPRGRPCSICTDEKLRPLIDSALANGNPHVWIARKYSVEPDSVRNHALKHLPAFLAQSAEARNVAASETVLGQVKTLVNEGLAQYADWQWSPEHARGWFDRLLRGLELLGRVSGEIQQGAQVQIAVFQRFGVRDEAEGLELVELGRQVREGAGENLDGDAVTVLRETLRLHPEKRTQLLADLFGMQEVAEAVHTNGGTDAHAAR